MSELLCLVVGSIVGAVIADYKATKFWTAQYRELERCRTDKRP